MRSKSACGDSFLRIESCFCLRSGRLLGKKNGIPLYPNLVNLKSNTMKNTLQRYDGCFLYASDLQEKISECYEFNLNYNFVKVLSCKNGFLLVEDVEREDDGALLRHPQKPMAKKQGAEPGTGIRQTRSEPNQPLGNHAFPSGRANSAKTVSPAFSLLYSAQRSSFFPRKQVSIPHPFPGMLEKLSIRGRR